MLLGRGRIIIYSNELRAVESSLGQVSRFVSLLVQFPMARSI